MDPRILSSSVSNPAAVDDESLTRDIRRGIGSQVDGHRTDILRLAETAQWDLSQPCVNRFTVRHVGFCKVSLDPAWANRVNAYLVARPFDRQHLHKLHQSAFRQAINRIIRGADEAINRAHSDGTAEPLLY